MNFVILCGGSGSRLWPKSREKMPKQFLKMTNCYTMLQNTILRIQKMIEITGLTTNSITIICNKDHWYIADVQIKELCITVPITITIVAEPKGRDSAPAVCIASLLGLEEDNTCIMPCDHIFDDEALTAIYKRSLNQLDDSIITFGIKPTHGETGYGYIKKNENEQTVEFVEKPNVEMAKQYFESGDFLWNAGIFMFKNKNMLQCFRNYAPDILENCQETLKNSASDKNQIIHLSETPFISCRSISVDYAIMEPLCKDLDTSIKRFTFSYDAHWNDIGSFSALFNELEKDADNNVINGDVILLNSSNCYVESERSLIAGIDLHDLIIIDTDDAILLCPQNKTQDVKKIVEILKSKKREEAQFHKKVLRPWGWYINIYGSDNNGFKVKTISVYPGKKLSLQSHDHRSEHWAIVRGNAKVTLNQDEIILEKDQSVYIPVKALHRIENIGSEILEFTETQIGNYLGEDDIVRYEDDFGRV